MSYSPYYFYVLQDKKSLEYTIVRELKELSSVLSTISPGIDVLSLYAQVTAGAEEQIFETSAYKLYKTKYPSGNIYATQFKETVVSSAHGME
jgi:hypothetical protein